MFVRLIHVFSSSLPAALLSGLLAPAALAGPPCDADGRCSADACRRPARYACRVTVETEPIEKECYLIEPEAVCIPPITTSPFDCVRDLFRGKKSRGGHGHGCGADGCTAAGCDGGCGLHGGRPRKAGWLAKLCDHGRGCCGGIRCVNTLDTHEYECGERCVCKWEAVPVGGCGVDCGPHAGTAGPARTHAAPAPQDGAVPPAPAPTPAPPTLRYDLPELEADAAEPSELERGVADQAIEE
ncbi:hypothetical protein [Alienimonas sp. DA493]|uniref:hypothetical protein n=1 Tax=Alienimonas sp. DA493 TaxID=3373605 RepID=UPI0037546B42